MSPDCVVSRSRERNFLNEETSIRKAPYDPIVGLQAATDHTGRQKDFGCPAKGFGMFGKRGRIERQVTRAQTLRPGPQRGGERIGSRKTMSGNKSAVSAGNVHRGTKRCDGVGGKKKHGHNLARVFFLGNGFNIPRLVAKGKPEGWDQRLKTTHRAPRNQRFALRSALIPGLTCENAPFPNGATSKPLGQRLSPKAIPPSPAFRYQRLRTFSAKPGMPANSSVAPESSTAFPE